jgi:hypothetical protein
MMALILSLMLFLTVAKDVMADTPPPAYIPLNADQLDQLVAPIALDPDPLVAQILTAATYPDQVAAADTWSNANVSLPVDQRASGADAMAWDPAIKGLIAFPDVLDNLAKNGSWTAQLGNAYFNQPDDVMNAIQALRKQAQEANVLVTTPQERVVVAADVINVVPVEPAVVYVPYYNPWRIWGKLFVAFPGYVIAPPPVGIVAVAGVAFEPPITVAAFATYNWGFASWTPAWTSGAVFFHGGAYISSSTTVINHGFFGAHDRGVFEHGGRGVPNGYHACAHVGAGRSAAAHAHMTSYGHSAHSTTTRSATRTGSPSSARSYSKTQASKSASRTQARNSYSSKAGNHTQAHSSNATHSAARNTHSSSANRSQARSSRSASTNHAGARNTHSAGASNHSQARSNTRSSNMNRSQARSSRSASTNHAGPRNTHSAGANNHSQTRSNTRSSNMNRSQARSTRSASTSHAGARNTRSVGTGNRSQGRAPRSSGAGSHPQARTVANHQSGGRSAGGHAGGGKRR